MQSNQNVQVQCTQSVQSAQLAAQECVHDVVNLCSESSESHDEAADSCDNNIVINFMFGSWRQAKPNIAGPWEMQRPRTTARGLVPILVRESE